ncbi:recombinase family protein [Phosphitispora sp. TUW77]|uniref:recombinase family protein n=1 Tax=Phosphitispora sp. TUW77 TaxID=3152361 RepID=UPI003AB65CF7
MKEKVLGYVRVSTQGQVKDGYSLAYQVEEIQSYCTRHGLELVNIYQDAGISGAKVDMDELTIDREGLQEMLSDLAWQEVEYIVVLNTSRLWRSDIVKVLIQRELKRYKVDVKAIEQPTYSIYAHDPTDVLVNGILELLDQYQRLEIALKLSRGRRKKAQQGGYAGGRVAFGYAARKGQKVLQVDEEQANTIRYLFELREQYPGWSLSQYAAELNRAGHKTAQGKLFTKVQVKRILDREALYRGHYRYGLIEAQGQHQSII